MPSKEEEAEMAAREAKETDDGALPVYQATVHGPTIDSPFDFPSDEPPPPFTAASQSASSSASTKSQRPIAIPQTSPEKTEPFLDAYSQRLLQYGIPPESWRAFLSTMSAFLAAKVSEQAVAHAADVGRHVSTIPKRFGKETARHAKDVGNNIRDSAKSGNYVGAAMGVVSGAIFLPVGAAVRAVGATVSLPFAAMHAVAQKPQTPRERAIAYAAAANEKWLGARGLRAGLVDTAELARMADVPVSRLLDIASAANDRDAGGKIDALKDYIAELETFEGSSLRLGANTLWLVVLEQNPAVAAPAPSTNEGRHRRRQ
ncbi:hypothetical protein L207DRAFT_521159 [Hyaloscypha variabilis F]|uniref:Uncharacterized protein n=1 Tax=Hyaloscypha variabilis (strain UAMH 11265 / GT02V1 / F) TaxID=1149755 RepID=A0A2J6QSF9_HYAVF|nr:hypothetical protein L207DRAFT_521159 [Hyaloscypha variabilis F]